MPGSREFGSLLDKLMKAADLSQSEFARRVGKKPGVIQFIRQGVRTPPLESIDQWAEVLGLNEVQRRRFRRLAAIAHLPPSAQPEFIKIVDELEKLRADYLRLRDARP